MWFWLGIGCVLAIGIVIGALVMAALLVKATPPLKW
jgi:hypothetical protein